MIEHSSNRLEHRPLSGKRLVVTRSVEQAEDLAQHLRQQGGEVLFLPAIEIHPPASWQEIDQAIDQLQIYDWIIFTSSNAVRFFLGRLQHQKKDIQHRKNIKVCAIGEGTAQALKEFQVPVDVIPQESLSESITTSLSEIEDLREKKILLPQAQIARKVLLEQLQEAGAEVHTVVAYRTLPASLSKDQIRQLTELPVNWVLFTSSSTVKNFVEQVQPILGKEWFAQVRLASIGPITSGTLREFQLEPAVESIQAGMAALTQAIVEYELSNTLDE